MWPGRKPLQCQRCKGVLQCRVLHFGPYIASTKSPTNKIFSSDSLGSPKKKASRTILCKTSPRIFRFLSSQIWHQTTQQSVTLNNVQKHWGFLNNIATKCQSVQMRQSLVFLKLMIAFVDLHETWTAYTGQDSEVICKVWGNG